MRGKRWFNLLSVGLMLALLVSLFGSAEITPGPARAQDGQFATPPGSVVASPPGTVFTYQGQLKQDGNPVNGTCDFQFSLWDALSDGSQMGSTQSPPPISVADGTFTVQLDFGSGAFQGDARWLEIAVCCPTGCDPTITLAPRQALTAAPYALALPGLWTQQNVTSTNLIGGYSGNWVLDGVWGATIGGGGYEGNPNRVTGIGGTVGGGRANQAGDDPASSSAPSFGTVGGGSDNSANGDHATVGGGYGNTASGIASTVAGGAFNSASGNIATIGGGMNNSALGHYATVPGGYSCTAEGDYSFAAGNYAVANNQGCFVWGDASVAGNVECNVNNQWVARSSGGVYFQTNYNGTTGSYLAAGGNSWNSISDRTTKENFSPADGQAILETLALLPVQEYNLKSQDDSIRHVGLVAQDFAAFGYGESDTAINMQDADGVAMAAIQGLYADNQALKAQVASLQQQNAGLEARLAALEQAVHAGQPAQTGTRRSVSWLLVGGLVVASGTLVSCRRWPGGRR